MDALTMFAVAVGLAMDAFAVSIAAGIRLGCAAGAGHVLRLAFYFGFFQGFMTLLGWAGGAGMQQLIRSADHWVAAGLLAFIGGKMIWEAACGAETLRPDCDPTRGLTVLMLSVATSVDAFAVGLSLGVLGDDVVRPALVIGAVAAAFTVAGMRLGNRIGTLVGRKVEVLGGIILIGIGVRILVEHILRGI